MSTGRLEAFSDGVFAIAITLLVIELRPPAVQRGSELAGALWDLWPSYFAYLVSFVSRAVTSAGPAFSLWVRSPD